jgi:hypothetical protein
MRTARLGYLSTSIHHKYIQIHVAEEIMNEVEILISPAVSEVLRRIDSLKSSENISLEEKIRIAELVLSVLEEERDGGLMVQ